MYVGHRVSSLPWQNGWLCFRPRLTLFSGVFLWLFCRYRRLLCPLAEWRFGLSFLLPVAFDMFDVDGSGRVTREEALFVLRYGVCVSPHA